MEVSSKAWLRCPLLPDMCLVTAWKSSPVAPEGGAVGSSALVKVGPCSLGPQSHTQARVLHSPESIWLLWAQLPPLLTGHHVSPPPEFGPICSIPPLPWDFDVLVDGPLLPWEPQPKCCCFLSLLPPRQNWFVFVVVYLSSFFPCDSTGD